MQHGDDRDRFRFIYEIDGIGKLIKQRAAHVFFNDRKPKRIIVYVLEGSAYLTEESEA